MSGWILGRVRLSHAEARFYAASLEIVGAWRVEVFHVAQGVATVELRPRGRPVAPAIVLRTAAECEARLRDPVQGCQNGQRQEPAR